MAITLFHHPFSRASNVVWVLEELGVPYELSFVDLQAGAQKSPELLALNPMGKLPTLVDDGVVVTESAAIALYLADRYSYGDLAPKIDDPKRAAYLRWSFFAPSVVEPASTSKMQGWDAKASMVGWGTYDDMLATMEHAISAGTFLLGDKFSMADVVFGGTLRYMLRFKLVEPRPSFAGYAERLAARPALQRAEAKNAEVMKQHGIQFPGG